MRIISKVRDFYDWTSNPADRDHMWVRHPKDIYLKWDDPISKFFHSFRSLFWTYETRKQNSDNWQVRMKIAFICNKIYPFFEAAQTWGYNQNFTFDEIKEEKIHFDEILKLFEDKSYNFKYNGSEHFTQNFNKLFKILNGPECPACLKNLNLKYNSPVLILEYNQIKLNYECFKLTVDGLIGWNEFQTKLDPYQISQEIEQFLWNDLAAENQPPVEVDDKIKAESHGYDKWSFRKEPKSR